MEQAPSIHVGVADRGHSTFSLTLSIAQAGCVGSIVE